MKKIYLAFIILTMSSGVLFTQNNVQSQELLNSDIFSEAEKVTGCPAEILRGIAGAESHFTITAVGDNGQSHGMFQLHNRWHDYRVAKYGVFDPFDPAEAAIIAGFVIQENLQSFDGNLRLAIAAYKQGVTGVRRNGVIDEYVNEVIFWRKDDKKMMAFFIFLGIIDLGVIEDGRNDFRTQFEYQFEDTLTPQISRRRCGGIPY
jgi:hypothetical protein